MYSQVKLPIPGDQILARLRKLLPRPHSNLTCRLGGKDSRSTARVRLIEEEGKQLLQLTYSGPERYPSSPTEQYSHFGSTSYLIDLEDGNILKTKHYGRHLILTMGDEGSPDRVTYPDVIDDVTRVLSTNRNAHLDTVHINSSVTHGKAVPSHGMHYVHHESGHDRAVVYTTTTPMPPENGVEQCRTEWSYLDASDDSTIERCIGRYVCEYANGTLTAFRPSYVREDYPAMVGAILSHCGDQRDGHVIQFMNQVLESLFGEGGIYPDTDSLQYVMERYLKIHDRQSRNGFERLDPEYYASKVHEEMDEVYVELAAGNRDAAELEIGDLLSVVLSMCHKLGFSPAHALTRAARKFEVRVARCEEYFKEHGMDSTQAVDEEWAMAWKASKIDGDSSVKSVSDNYHKPIPGFSSL